MRKTILLLTSMAVALAVAGGAALAVTPIGTSAGTDRGALKGAKDPDAKLDRALKRLVAKRGGPPGVIAVVQRGEKREVHAFGVANLLTDRTQAGQVAAAIEAEAGPGDVVAYCPDQLGPGTSRLLDDGPPGVRFPDAGDPRFVDWVDYAARVEAGDPAAFADEVVERAGGGDVWLVWSGEYRTVEGVCEELVNALAARRPGWSVVVQSGDQFEHAWLHRYAAP